LTKGFLRDRAIRDLKAYEAHNQPRGRTFRDLAKLSTPDVEAELGESKSVMFLDGERIVQFRASKVKAGGMLTLEGEGKKVVAEADQVTFTDGAASEKVDAATPVMMSLTTEIVQAPADGTLMTSGSFTQMSAGSASTGTTPPPAGTTAPPLHAGTTPGPSGTHAGTTPGPSGTQSGTTPAPGTAAGTTAAPR
jgi:hypothetical protein